MRTQHTISDLVDFIMLNRRDKVLKLWTPIQIADLLVTAVEDRVLVYSVGSDGKIDGVIAGVKFEGCRTLSIEVVLTTCKGVFNRMIDVLYQWYPEYAVEAKRHGRSVTYNVPRLVSKVLKYETTT